MNDIVVNIQRAYSHAVYQATKAILQPVVAATHDVIRDAVVVAVKEGVRDALSPADVVSDFLFGRKKK